MSWELSETLAWRAPLDVAHEYADHDMALLYSGLSEKFTGGDSYLLLNPIEEISGSDWAQLPTLPATGDALPLWVGYLGYGMREARERGATSPATLPGFRLVRYGMLYHFNHEACTLRIYQSDHPASPPTHRHPGEGRDLLCKNYNRFLCTMDPGLRRDDGQWMGRDGDLKINSNLTRAEYEKIVAETITQIRDGNFYQANITRKFFGAFAQTPESFTLFEKLVAASPAPYSAYIKHGATTILSSSPECFLSIDAHGVMTTRPIKGSARRSADENEDEKIRNSLAQSTKNHAENLMIVDLMRNDLSRVAKPNSVEVIEQSSLYSYRTIHHLISTVRAQKRTGISAYDAVHACFPAGSMTGAPKIAAMRWCTAQEKLERGVYSGAIGWFGPGDTCDLSVVIRTLILDGKHFEFQVGGGIVADSTPEDEWRETIAKARGICAALGLSEADLEKL